MEEHNPTLIANTSQHVMNDEQSQQVAQIMTKRIQTNTPHRRILLQEIKANLSYLVGEQNIYYDNGNIMPISNVRLRNPVANIILPAVQKDVAVATQNPPVYDFVPAGTDDDDKATATVAHKLMQHIQRVKGSGLDRARTVLWYDIAGVGWRKVYWNPNATVMGVNPGPENEDGSPNPQHNPEMEVGAAIMQGEVEIEAIPPSQLIYDFREPRLDKLDWMIHAKTVTRQWVLDTYGPDVTQAISSHFTAAHKESEFEAKIVRQFNAGIADEVQSTATPKLRGDTLQLLEADQYIDYYEYWQKPTKLNPAGMFAVMLGDQVVHHEPFPVQSYPHNELPFIPCAPLSLGEGIGTALPRISLARPIQREFNRLRAQISENIDVMGNAIIMAPRTAKLKYRTLDNGAANIIEYEGPQGKPHREAGVPMNPQVFAYLASVKEDLEGLFAFNEVTRGVAPRNIESGRGIMALQDADRTHMQPIVREFEEADRAVAYQAVSIALANYEPERQINCVGDDYGWTLYAVDRDQFRGKFNVILKPLSSMPMDKDAEASRSYEAWKAGLLGDPNDPDIRIWTLEQMRLGNQDNLLQKNSKQRNFAQKEFLVANDNVRKMDIPPGVSEEKLAQEIKMRTYIPIVNQFDDHAVHLQVHGDFMLDHYWDIVAESNPILMEMLMNMTLHIQQHQQVLQAREQAAFAKNLEAEMLIKGTTPAQLMLKKGLIGLNETQTKGKQ